MSSIAGVSVIIAGILAINSSVMQRAGDGAIGIHLPTALLGFGLIAIGAFILNPQREVTS